MAENEKKLSRERRKRKRLDHRLRLTEVRDRVLHKDRSSERAVLEEVLDRSTLMTLYNFLNKGTINEIYGAVKSGKEAKIYWGRGSKENELAIKIYLVTSSEFKRGRIRYIEGDPRFTHIRRDTRSLVYTWAQKEFKNLQSAYNARVKVPKPFAVSNNVLIMQFIGKNGVSAPLLKDAVLKDPQQTYQQVVESVSKLYITAELVHADLSEYNIMIWRNRPVLFDVSQAVPVKHPMADTFFRRDLKNLNQYFEKRGVNVPTLDEMYRRVRGGGS